MRSIILIAHNLRSTHNVGSLLRTAEGLGINKVVLSGYTPYPQKTDDDRLPHLSQKIDRQINKTALGATQYVPWQYLPDPFAYIQTLKADGYQVVAIEQAEASSPLHAFTPPPKIALIVGREVEGIESELIDVCDRLVEIPMLGKKESFNVVQAAAMALYHCRFQ